MPGAEIYLEIRGLDGMLARLRALGPRFDASMKRGLSLAGHSVEQRIKERISYRGGYSREFLHMRTGKLAQSVWTDTPKKAADGWQVSLGFRKGPAGKYAVVHEFGGEKRYFLKPKRKKALSWVGPSGQRFFSKGHWRDPLPARAPVRTAMKERRDIVRDYIAGEIKRELDAAHA